MTGPARFQDTIHPERSIDGFTALDGTVRFYGFVRACMLQTEAKRVLDFGAGRGAALQDDPSLYRRHLRDLRFRGAEVVAADIDDAVLLHVASDSQVVLTLGAPLPFDDESFDVIVSDMTFEHLEEPEVVAKDLLRVLRPGGYICARTPNRRGYVAMLSRMVPNHHHTGALKSIQPHRKAQDVFPAFYRLNDGRTLRKAFAGCEVSYFIDSSEPAYHFGSSLIYRMMLFSHRLLPAGFATTLNVFIQKPADG